MEYLPFSEVSLKLDQNQVVLAPADLATMGGTRQDRRRVLPTPVRTGQSYVVKTDSQLQWWLDVLIAKPPARATNGGPVKAASADFGE
jgi:hypothetical protein